MGGDRRLGVAVDFSACSRKALKWAVDNLVRDEDHLVLITVQPDGYYEEGEKQLWATTGSRKLLLYSSLVLITWKTSLACDAFIG